MPIIIVCSVASYSVCSVANTITHTNETRQLHIATIHTNSRHADSTCANYTSEPYHTPSTQTNYTPMAQTAYTRTKSGKRTKNVETDKDTRLHTHTKRQREREREREAELTRETITHTHTHTHSKIQTIREIHVNIQRQNNTKITEDNSTDN